MKKSYILLGIIIIVFILLILNFKNSNSELATILNKKPEIPNNIYVKEEMVNNANTTTITNTYRKDKFIYQHIENDDSTANQDILWDFEAKKEIIIDNLSKTIDVIKISDDELSPLEGVFVQFNENLNTYKYDGKEMINENNCIKFHSTKDSNNRTYFYVDADTGLLYQKEEGQYYNSTFTPYYKYNYTYSYDTVTDEDIFVFNIENYPDYIYTEE